MVARSHGTQGPDHEVTQVARAERKIIGAHRVVRPPGCQVFAVGARASFGYFKVMQAGEWLEEYSPPIRKPSMGKFSLELVGDPDESLIETTRLKRFHSMH